MPTLWTIGYERLLPLELVNELRLAGVQRVIDVRYRPQSRRPGMSKTRLARLLHEHGIRYEHRRALGTPPEIRVLYRAGATRSAAQAFAAHVESAGAGDLDALAEELVTAPPTALLCLEALPEHCHRSVVAGALRRRLPELVVVDL